MLIAPTLGDLLRAAAEEAPHAEAFRYRDERLTYAEWDQLADHLAAKLGQHGVHQGDVVALLLPSTPLYHLAYAAGARLGAVTTGVNARYRRAEIGHILRRSGAALLLAVESWHDADFRGVVDRLRPELPELRHVLWLSADAIRTGTRQALGLLGASGRAPTIAVAPDDPLAIVFTSGTTGMPRGACYTHRNLMALLEIEARRYPEGMPTGQRGISAGLSFAHVGTMTRLPLQIANLGSLLIHDTFDPAAVLAAIERDRLVHLGGIPTQLILLLDHPDRRQRDLTSLRSVLIGGAPATPALIRRIQDELHVQVSVRYSSTEVGIATASVVGDPPEILATTVGKPTPGVDLRIVDAKNQPLAATAVGEVVIRSPATMRCYWREPEATAAKVDAEGWIHTGDLGFLDGSGYLHLRGRQSEMFIRGGYNVYPSEVEDVLARHPGVARAAVVGVPDAVFGEIGWAFVVPRDASEPATLAELRQFVGQELASFKRPDGLTLVPDLPVNAMFKVDKRTLAAQHAEEAK